MQSEMHILRFYFVGQAKSCAVDVKSMERVSVICQDLLVAAIHDLILRQKQDTRGNKLHV